MVSILFWKNDRKALHLVVLKVLEILSVGLRSLRDFILWSSGVYQGAECVKVTVLVLMGASWSRQEESV